MYKYFSYSPSSHIYSLDEKSNKNSRNYTLLKWSSIRLSIQIYELNHLPQVKSTTPVRFPPTSFGKLITERQKVKSEEH